MPIYTYDCTECRWHGDRVVSLGLQNKEADSQFCDQRVYLTLEDMNAEKVSVCGGKLKREEIPLGTRHIVKEEYGAVLSNGEVVPGHWGKEAPNERKKWTPPD